MGICSIGTIDMREGVVCSVSTNNYSYTTMKDNSFMLENYFPKKLVFVSPTVQRNSLFFAIAMTALQVGLSLVYGFLILIPGQLINVGSIITMIALAILIVAGFGLVFGYTKRMIWSGIGFNLLITALCLELYPLINDFWTRTKIQNGNSPLINFGEFNNRFYQLYLANRDTNTGATTATTAAYYGNCMTNALKCALSVAVAFSAILGRAGHLECFFVVIFGTVGFELNRQIIQSHQGQDAFGTYYIFTFGGFMGLVLGLFSWVREKRVEGKENLQTGRATEAAISLRRYTGKEYSVLYAVFGSLIIFALFPFLAYEFDAYINVNSYSSYVGPLCVIVAMGAGTLGSIMVSTLINGQLIARDAIHGPIAGAIAVGASSLYITTPVWALVAGCSGGIVQALIQNTIERAAINRRYIISTVSWSLFGLQGIIGAAFATGWKAIAYGSRLNSLTPDASVLADNNVQFEFYAGLISAGIGAGFGVLAGLLIFIFNGQTASQYFEDYFYWQGDDGLRVPTDKSQAARSEHKLQQPTPVDQRVEIEDLQFDFSEGEEVINEYAYL